LLTLVLCVQHWESWGHGDLPKSGEEELVGLLTVDTQLLTQPLLQAWHARGVRTPIVFGKLLESNPGLIKRLQIRAQKNIIEQNRFISVFQIYMQLNLIV
jgi:hypothetical protein